MPWVNPWARKLIMGDVGWFLPCLLEKPRVQHTDHGVSDHRGRHAQPRLAGLKKPVPAPVRGAGSRLPLAEATTQRSL